MGQPSKKKRPSTKAKPRGGKVLPMGGDPFAAAERASEEERAKIDADRRERAEAGPPASERERLGIADGWKPRLNEEGVPILDPDDYYELAAAEAKCAMLIAQVERLKSQDEAELANLRAAETEFNRCKGIRNQNAARRREVIEDRSTEAARCKGVDIANVKERIRQKYSLPVGAMLLGDDRSVKVVNDGGAAGPPPS